MIREAITQNTIKCETFGRMQYIIQASPLATSSRMYVHRRSGCVVRGNVLSCSPRVVLAGERPAASQSRVADDIFHTPRFKKAKMKTAGDLVSRAREYVNVQPLILLRTLKAVPRKGKEGLGREREGESQRRRRETAYSTVPGTVRRYLVRVHSASWTSTVFVLCSYCARTVLYYTVLHLYEYFV